jgi:preprotein translocase subunit SecG
MFSRILLGLLIVDSLILIAAVLLQAGKGGGLAASFGGVTSSADAILGTRQAGNILTKISWWGGGLFLALAFMLSLSSSQQSAPRSILDQTFTPQPVQPAPATTQPNTPASNILPVSPAPTGDTKTPTPAPTKTP